jgi:hypothetical protein
MKKPKRSSDWSIMIVVFFAASIIAILGDLPSTNVAACLIALVISLGVRDVLLELEGEDK